MKAEKLEEKDQGGKARVLSGIGSYVDQDSSKDADQVLRRKLRDGLDDLIGEMEWIKTDQAKKGARKHLDGLERLSLAMERMSRRIESSLKGDVPLLNSRRLKDSVLSQLFGYDQKLVDSFSAVAAAVQDLTKEQAVPRGEALDRIHERIKGMEKTLTERESLMAGQM
jgi:hypothetical protein